MLRPASTLCLPLIGEALGCADPKPPSDEGGGKSEGFDGGREDLKVYTFSKLCKNPTFSLPQSASLTAPSSEGAFRPLRRGEKTEIVLAFMRGMCYNNNKNHY